MVEGSCRGVSSRQLVQCRERTRDDKSAFGRLRASSERIRQQLNRLPPSGGEITVATSFPSRTHPALLAILAVPMAYSQAQVSVGIGVGPVGIGVGPAYVGAPPVCSHGYYGYYPYACAPYGYYGPDWFVGGIFVGAGPWFHGRLARPLGMGQWVAGSSMVRSSGLGVSRRLDPSI